MLGFIFDSDSRFFLTSSEILTISALDLFRLTASGDKSRSVNPGYDGIEQHSVDVLHGLLGKRSRVRASRSIHEVSWPRSRRIANEISISDTSLAIRSHLWKSGSGLCPVVMITTILRVHSNISSRELRWNRSRRDGARSAAVVALRLVHSFPAVLADRLGFLVKKREAHRFARHWWVIGHTAFPSVAVYLLMPG